MDSNISQLSADISTLNNEEITDETDFIWSLDVENAFEEAYNLYPKARRIKLPGSDGLLYGTMYYVLILRISR